MDSVLYLFKIKCKEYDGILIELFFVYIFEYFYFFLLMSFDDVF